MSDVRVYPLTSMQAGMTRLRDKGGASPKAAYEITNGYVDASGAPSQRPGTDWIFNWADPHLGKGAQAGQTKGLAFYNGVFYTFTSGNGAGSGIVSGGGTTYQILVLRHPTSTSVTLTKIHFAKPFLGFLYVVAQFSDGYTAHYWLQNPPAWTGNTVYLPNALVQPTTNNGFYYSAQLLNPPGPTAWTPLLGHNLGDVIQPSTPNGFNYYAKFLSAGNGASTTTTGSSSIPAIGGSITLNVASSTGFSATAGNVVGVVSDFVGVYQGTVTATGAGTVTLKVTNIVYGTGINSGATVSQQVDRSGATEPVWITPGGSLTLDVGAATQPPVSAAAPTQPGPVAPGTGAGGKYGNPGGSLAPSVQPN